MPRFYLSTFVGLGTLEDPFRPKVSLYGKTRFLDFRPDETKREGWAISCLESDGDLPPLSEAGILLLTDDPNAELQEESRSQIRQALQVDFLSTTLTNVCLEILLLNKIQGRGLRPDVNGEYRLYLGSLLASLSEEQAIAFVGDLIDRRNPFTPSQIVAGDPNSLVLSLSKAMNELREVIERDMPGWLEKATVRYASHPVVRTYVAARDALAAGYEAASASPEAIEIMTLARDIRVLGPQLNLGRWASRLRAAGDCKPAQYELYVMAGYVQAGAAIEMTDTARTGECNATWGGPWVHLECKAKTVASLGPRHLKEVLDRGNDLIRQAMAETGRKALVWITCRQDPRVEELASIASLVRDALGRPQTELVRSGKFEISVISGREGAYYENESRGVLVPAGFEYAFTESRMHDGKAGEPAVSDVWGVAWRTTKPQGWVRSALESIREAGKLDDDHPNIVYLQVPPGPCGIVRARIEILVAPVTQLLENHSRLNCVVLTGFCTRETGPHQNAVVSVAYRPVYNPSARLQLPEGFRVMGAHFTRK